MLLIEPHRQPVLSCKARSCQPGADLDSLHERKGLPAGSYDNACIEPILMPDYEYVSVAVGTTIAPGSNNKNSLVVVVYWGEPRPLTRVDMSHSMMLSVFPAGLANPMVARANPHAPAARSGIVVSPKNAGRVDIRQAHGARGDGVIDGTVSLAFGCNDSMRSGLSLDAPADAALSPGMPFSGAPSRRPGYE